MPNTRVLNRSFAGGEISPEMYGRIDDAKYQSGAALMKNFIATPQGPAVNRAGFEYVTSTKNNGVARLIPFIFSPEQTMIVELGAGYFRFHTDAETLVYSTAGMRPWVVPSGNINISRSTAAVVAWTAHGLTTGDPIRFYLFGGSTTPPSGLKAGYRYTVVVIDADNFTLLDNGVQVDLTAPTGAVAANYVGAGTTSAYAEAMPGFTASQASSALTGLGSHAVTGGVATLNVTLTSQTNFNAGIGSALIEYQYNVGSGWVTFYSVTDTGEFPQNNSISTNISLTNTNLLQLRVSVTAHSIKYDSVTASGEINTWNVDTPAVAIDPVTTEVRAYRDYTTGAMVSYGGSSYVALIDNNGGLVTPGSDASVWNLLPASLIYEVPNAYAEADLFQIHYAQSADVLTLVHPNYPPAELKRLSATSWTFTNIAFGQALAAPAGVSVTASPGLLVTIASVAAGVYTTVSNHTLAYTDPVYISGGSGTLATGFYLVADVPLDGSGNPIKNQLKLMDYNGAAVTGTVVGSPTIQFGSKIINITNYYVVTAMAADGINESAVSVEVSALCNLNVTGSYNNIGWKSVATAARYRVYKKKNGLYGFIGETTALTFSDNNIAPDFSITPPIFDSVFGAAGEYPGAVGYFDQRRTFGGSTNKPQDVTMTKTGTESDVSYSIPVKDTERISFRVASREANKIVHIVPLNELLLLTSSAELRVSAVNSEALTPTNLSVRPQSYIGASSIQPSVINNSLMYCAARGGHVREMGYSWQSSAFVTGDLSLRSKHLFDNLIIVDQAYTKSPVPIVWFVSSNGKLLGITYIPEEQIGAWHQHTTDGYFESIAAVPEGNEDKLYAVIRRIINGQTVRFIERMATRLVGNIEDCFFVDAGKTYDGAPTVTVSGMTWLEGKTVAILADGAVKPQQVVTDGAITLDHAASVVQVGLPIVADLGTLPLTLQIEAFGQGRTKNINKVWLKVSRSSGVFAGPDVDHLTESKQRTTEPYGTPPELRDDEIEIVITPAWQDSGQVFIRQSNPLPLTVVAVTMQVSIG